ncbi:MarR family transcriptional regulator [Halobaculum sp. WSA2]|uniref:MarR family transcriptional regulator n=1 Tax=Halobaculum saliterrae TaxID=2073113 RepID=A0A6B0SU59_9EURY|nr:MarR family transcriptional regulator [Halobaculum saliterrae]MXR42508.1 MarR family transcriptional regulator [Halobaculum saliterrae]
MSQGKTDLQREILLTWHEHPNATNAEIAEACDCSASYVSQVKNRFDGYDEMEAMFDRQDRELEQMFGDGILDGSSQSVGGTSSPSASSLNGEPGIAEMYEDLPDNAAGNLIRVMILLVLLYVLYEIVMALVL